MKSFLRTALSGLMALALPGIMMAQTQSRCYGIQIYSNTDPEGTQKIVSVSVDNPGNVKIDQEFGNIEVTAAACYDGIYYMLQTDDGLIPSKFITYDIAHKTFNEVKVLDFNQDELGSLIVLDMTYSPTDGYLYAVGADLGGGTIIEGELNAPFGLYRIDPATGNSDLIGYQETVTIIALAADNNDLWGVDENGNLWIISSATGEPEDIIWNSGITPIGTQSMSYDFENNCFYWASYTSAGTIAGTEFPEGKSELISFTISDEWEVEKRELGAIGDDVELIGLYVESNPVNPAAPESVSEFTVTPAANGIEEAQLSWTNPSRTFGGAELTGSLSISISRGNEVVSTLEGMPGEQMTWTDTEVPSALYTYSITVSQGDLTGATIYASPTFIGADIPGAPYNVKGVRAEEGYDITISWEAPQTGANNGWYDASDLKYCVVRYPDNKVVVASTSETSVVDTDITVQAGYSYGVKVLLENGYGPEGVSNIVVSGPALNLPYSMTLDKADANLWSIVDGDGDGYTWYLHTTGWGGTWDPFFYYHPEENLNPMVSTNEWLISPSFALEKNKKYIIEYDLKLFGTLFLANNSLWIGTSNTPESMDRELVSNESQNIDMVWETQMVNFTVEETGAYNFGFKVTNRVPAQFYKFNIREASDVDLEMIGLAGPSTASVGSPFVYQAEVRNAGYAPISNFEVKLRDTEGAELASATVTDELTPGNQMKVSIEWTPAIQGEMQVVATVEAAGDDNSSNNSSSPLTVNVIGGGDWIDITDGNSSTGFSPVFARAKNSASQTIYNADLLTEGEGKTIKALTYYIASYFGSALEMDLEMWLTEVAESEFEDPFGYDLSDFTKVYEGKLQFNPAEQTVTIILDEPYLYNGGNLVIAARHHSENTATIAFRGIYDANGPHLTVSNYSDTEVFDFTDEMLYLQDRPNVSILVVGNDGVESWISDSGCLMRYDRAKRTLEIEGSYTSCDIYDVSGRKLGHYNEGNVIRLSDNEGVVLVSVKTEKGTSVRKIAL